MAEAGEAEGAGTADFAALGGVHVVCVDGEHAGFFVEAEW